MPPDTKMTESKLPEEVYFRIYQELRTQENPTEQPPSMTSQSKSLGSQTAGHIDSRVQCIFFGQKRELDFKGFDPLIS